MTLQQEIYNEIIKNGEWVDKSGLLKITGYVSESGGKLEPGPNGFDVWLPDIEEADIDVLKPSDELLPQYKGRKGISKLRRLFNEIRFALPGDVKYRLHADDYTKADMYGKWTENDPLVTIADTAQKPHRKAGKPGYTGPERVTYNVYDLEQPKDLVQIGNYKGSERVVYLLPETPEGLEQAYKIDAAYQNIRTTAGRKAAWGIKPYFIDGKGDFYEMEGGGPGYKKVEGDYGYRPKKLDTHRKASFNYAMRKRKATPTLEYVTDWVRKTFTGLSDDEVTAFGEIYYAMNAGELDAKTTQRVLSDVVQHGEHSIALSKGGVNWHNNLVNTPAGTNLRKGASSTPEWYNKAKGISTDVGEVLRGGLSSPINPSQADQAAYAEWGGTLSRNIGAKEGVNLFSGLPLEDNPLWRMGEAGRAEHLKNLDALRYGGKLGRKVGAILPFVGAGFDAWDVVERDKTYREDPSALNELQYRMSQGTLATSWWAEPANVALGLGNLGIDAYRTITEEDKREEFGRTMRAIGKWSNQAARNTLSLL